jgi:2-amino-4-hydroxy-6-hydroxymethyldihydropteridine diphosphokinase
MPRVYVSIGSNVEREKNIASAVQALRAAYGPLTLSSVYESPPLGFDGDDFYNLVAAFDTGETPQEVRTRLLDIERAHGRVRQGGGWHSRTLDLDLLLYDDLVLEQDDLLLPRPEIERYAFVLAPLAEIAPEQRHPSAGLTYAEMWRRFDRGRQPIRIVALDLKG